MSQLLTALQGADENYLCSLANKGLYKRAQRELAESGVKTALAEEVLTASFADGTEVQISGALTAYRCSCPSRSICKHVLMAILKAQETSEPSGAEGDQLEPSAERKTVVAPPAEEAVAEAAAAPPFGYLLKATPAELRRLTGKRGYEKAVLALATQAAAEIEEGTTLKVALLAQGQTVYFLPQGELAAASCSCKQAGFCEHKANAVLQYIKWKTGELPTDYLPEAEETSPEFHHDTLPVIRQFAEHVLVTGLVRLGEDTADRFAQVAVICHSQRYADLERLLNRLAGRLKRYYRRSAAFDLPGVLDDLTQVVRLCRQLENEPAGTVSGRMFREQYLPVGSVTLHGLGARGWHTQSGYTGVTVYLYDSAAQSILTFTSTVADSAINTTPQKLYRAEAPWGITASLSAVAHSRLTLQNAKTSRKNQLSASAETIAQLTGATDLLDQAMADIQYADFREVVALLRRRLQQGQASAIAVLLPAAWGESQYDQHKQRFELPLTDAGGRCILLSVPYEESNKKAIVLLSKWAPEGNLTGPLLAEISLEQGQVVALPITLYKDEPVDLTLYQEPKQKKHRFNWQT